MELYDTVYNLILFTPILAFVHYGGFDFLGNLYQSTRQKFGKLLEMKRKLNEQNISITKIVTVTIVTIYSVIYYSLIQKFNKAVHKVNKHTYEVTYCIGGKIYKFYVKPKKGVHSVLQVIDHDNNDVTELIEPFFGPAEDFHHQEYTPYIFNYKSLTFNYFDGSNKTFEEYDKLSI